jgi:hypothetical protein
MQCPKEGDVVALPCTTKENLVTIHALISVCFILNKDSTSYEKVLERAGGPRG